MLTHIQYIYLQDPGQDVHKCPVSLQLYSGLLDFVIFRLNIIIMFIVGLKSFFCNQLGIYVQMLGSLFFHEWVSLQKVVLQC